MVKKSRLFGYIFCSIGAFIAVIGAWLMFKKIYPGYDFATFILGGILTIFGIWLLPTDNPIIEPVVESIATIKSEEPINDIKEEVK